MSDKDQFETALASGHAQMSHANPELISITFQWPMRVGEEFVAKTSSERMAPGERKRRDDWEYNPRSR